MLKLKIFLHPFLLYFQVSLTVFSALFFPTLPPALQMIPPLLALAQNRSKLKLYIAHLTDLCHDRDPSILSQLTPPSHYHHSDPEDWEEELQKMSVEQVVEELPVTLCCSSLHFLLPMGDINQRNVVAVNKFNSVMKRSIFFCFLIDHE